MSLSCISFKIFRRTQFQKLTHLDSKEHKADLSPSSDYFKAKIISFQFRV